MKYTATIYGIIASLSMTCTVAMARTLVWSEEFDYGSAPDSTLWSYDIGNGRNGWGNNELQNYTSDSSNVRIEGGNLIITALRDGSNFTSARVKTQDKLTFKYGTVEARIQTPDLGNGLWPAFWTLGNDHAAVGWPECGEIDIMEMGNSSAIADGEVNKRMGSHLHWDDDGSYKDFGFSYTSPTNLNGSFHIYRMEWTPDRILIFIDDEWVFTRNISSIPEFNAPHFFILNLAIGGQYTGIYDASGITAPFPAEYLIDYIRIYDEGDTVLGGSSTVIPPSPGMNFLENPGFEEGKLNPWQGYTSQGANENGGYVESTNSTYFNGGNSDGDHVMTHSGEYVCKVFGDFTGAENYNGFYQDVIAKPGSQWTAAGWALTHSQDLMVGENSAWIEVSFRDAADTILSCYRSALLTSANVSAGSWMNREVTEELDLATGTVIGSVDAMTAPTGTAKVRYQITFRQTNYDGGSMYFDDLSLVEKILPVTLTASLVSGDFKISFPTQDGVSYQMVWKSSLTNLNWIPIETIIGDGGTNSVSYAATNPACFYHISAP